VSHNDISRIVVVPNEFPYALPTGSLHYVAWSLSSIPREEIISIINEKWENKDVAAFENPPSFKTIPEIQHYHIIIRSQEDSSTPASRVFPPELE
jgi:hypothetical protein